MWGAIGGALKTGAGWLLGQGGAGAAINYASAKQQQRASARESQKGRNFAERMRNTEWQAGVEDMRAAGLNPALAYQQGGASAPQGSVGSMGASSMASSALQYKRVGAELKLLEAQAGKQDASAALDLTNASRLGPKATVGSWVTGALSRWQESYRRERAKREADPRYGQRGIFEGYRRTRPKRIYITTSRGG